MPSSSPSPKRARTSGNTTSKELHNLYQVIYNLNLGKSEISRYVLHCFLSDNEDWLKVRLYALVEPEDSADEGKEGLAEWKGYERMSLIEKSSSASALASSITAGEMHISGDQSKVRRKDSKGLKLHLNHDSSSPILVELSPSTDAPVSSLMDICCALIANAPSKPTPIATNSPEGSGTSSKQGNGDSPRHGNGTGTKQSSGPSLDDLEALRIQNEKLQHELRAARRQVSAAKGGYDAIEAKNIVQVPKGRSVLQPTVKKVKKIERGFADDDEW